LGWVFFFQAEDGIRYWSVTGVQTCALPISAAQAGPRSSGAAPSGPARRADRGNAERGRRRDAPARGRRHGTHAGGAAAVPQGAKSGPRHFFPQPAQAATPGNRSAVTSLRRHGMGVVFVLTAVT